MVLPNELRADYLYGSDKQGNRHVYTPMTGLPPASPLLGEMPVVKLHDKSINF